MRIVTTIDDRVTRLHVEGEIDQIDAAELREVGRSALTPHCSALRIDLSGVTFIGSSGLGALIAIRNESLAAHLLVLENLSATVHNVFAVSGLDSVFHIQQIQ